ncbi:hypothetical protein HNR16_001909 [Pseudoclavibacter chungangensis]|nr:hypothetical protein [Pseudoclavibacter chungangensis]NYJ67121.1 hypothetical protein [Pseudoclavibacter chungangensis]
MVARVAVRSSCRECVVAVSVCVIAAGTVRATVVDVVGSSKNIADL